MGPMNRPWWITAALAWTGVVAIVALVTWWVIDSAGEEVLAEPVREAVSPTATTSGPGAGDPPEPTARPTRRPTGATSGPVTETDDPTHPVTSLPSSPAPPPTSTRTAEDPAPVTRTMTWQGDAGLVRVSCTGPELRLEGASPADGYEVDTNTRHSGGELEVRFRSADGDREVEVHATCVDGTPRFRVEND